MDNITKNVYISVKVSGGWDTDLTTKQLFFCVGIFRGILVTYK